MLSFREILCLALYLQSVICRPTEQPTKFSLNSSLKIDEETDKADKNGPTMLQQTMDVASESQNTVTMVIQPKSDFNQGEKKLASYEKVPFAQFLPPRTRETARLEKESDQALFEKPKSNPVEGILEKFFHPTPLVDGISEDQKYGNSGDKFAGVGRALVNGFEGISNFLNAAVDFPVKAAKNTSRSITEALNQLGSRLVGLQ